MAASEASSRVHRESSKGIRSHEVLLRPCALTDKRWSPPSPACPMRLQMERHQPWVFFFYRITFPIFAHHDAAFALCAFPSSSAWPLDDPVGTCASHTHTHMDSRSQSLCVLFFAKTERTPMRRREEGNATTTQNIVSRDDINSEKGKGPIGVFTMRGHSFIDGSVEERSDTCPARTIAERCRLFDS